MSTGPTMALIEREALIEGRVDNDPVVIAAMCAPTIDPIHAAGGCYCRECSFGRKPHAEDMQDGYVYCQEQSKYMSADDFCSGGELGEAQDDG